jgi:hypothetical protein
MDDSPANVRTDPPNKMGRKKRLFIWSALPAVLVCVTLGWQAYEHIQEARDRIT